MKIIKSLLVLKLKELIVVCLYNGIRMNELALYGIDTYEFYKFNGEWKRIVVKEYLLFDFVFIKILK